MTFGQKSSSKILISFLEGTRLERHARTTIDRSLFSFFFKVWIVIPFSRRITDRLNWSRWFRIFLARDAFRIVKFVLWRLYSGFFFIPLKPIARKSNRFSSLSSLQALSFVYKSQTSRKMARSKKDTSAEVGFMCSRVGVWVRFPRVFFFNRGGGCYPSRTFRGVVWFRRSALFPN